MQGKERPTLDFINEADGVEVQLAFGYYKHEPTVALFHEDLLILIPKDVLVIALQQGWEEDYSIIHQDGATTTIHKEVN